MLTLLLKFDILHYGKINVLAILYSQKKNAESLHGLSEAVLTVDISDNSYETEGCAMISY